MPDRSVEELVRELISEQVQVEESVAVDADLYDDLGCDEDDIESIATDIEDAVGIVIPEGDEWSWGTVGDVIEFVRKHQKVTQEKA